MLDSEIPDMDALQYHVLKHFIESESVHQSVWDGIVYALRLVGMGYIASDKMGKPVLMSITVNRKGKVKKETQVFYVPSELAHVTLRKYLTAQGVKYE